MIALESTAVLKLPIPRDMAKSLRVTLFFILLIDLFNKNLKRKFKVIIIPFKKL
jgi:hypothetical protein